MNLRLCIQSVVMALLVSAGIAEAVVCERPYDELRSACSDGEVLDDGTAESHLGAASTASRRTYVQLFTPPATPSVYYRVCVAWARHFTAPSADISYEIVLYDDDGFGGEPGTLLAVIPATASDVPFVGSGFRFSSVPIAAPSSAGSLYIGFRYDPSTEIDFFFPVDESPSTPQQTISSSSNDGGSWLYTTSLGRALFIRAHSSSDYAVVPQALELTYGNSEDELPFRPNPRYQQVYLGSEVGRRWISGIRLRAGQNQEDERLCPELLQNLTITLSTTPRDVDNLSAQFSTNVGPDETIVFDGDFWIAARGSSRPGLHPFDIVVPLQRPFFFAGAGNLLLDINTHDDSLTPLYLFDTHTATDAVSRAYCADSLSCTAGDVARPPDTEGLVTMFFDPARPIFLDGFESGTTASWSSRQP